MKNYHCTSEKRFSVLALVSRLTQESSHISLRVVSCNCCALPDVLHVVVYHLHQPVWEKAFNITERTKRSIINIPFDNYMKTTQYKSFSICVRSEEFHARTAVDSSPGPIRYGFVSDFTTSDERKIDGVVENLRSLHITHVQFYDWNFRPHQYWPDDTKAEIYQDTMGKEISTRTLTKKIFAIQQAGMKALGYGAVYAAGREYVETHRKEALEDIEGNTINLINKFFIMNLGNRNWRKTILDQYTYAVEQMGFDGIHMDTYGFPKGGWGYSDSEMVNPEFDDLQHQFVSFIEKWSSHGDENIFNNVGGWPVLATSKAPQAACYIEVWPPHTRYSHLRTLVQTIIPERKPLIFAAYLKPFSTSFQTLDSHVNPLMSAKLLLAAASVLGATTLLFGEENGILTQPYYSDYAMISSHDHCELSRFIDHQVRYGELFYGVDLIDITESHGVGENREFDFKVDNETVNISHDGIAGTIWVTIKRTDSRIVLNLINLLDQTDDEWNTMKKPCCNSPSIKIQIPRYKKHMAIFADHPDNGTSDPMVLTQTHVQGVRGPSVEVEIPTVPLWITIWCELS